MQATELGDADIGILVGGLPTVRTALGTAQTAVTSHQATLTRIRTEVDDLRNRYQQQQTAFETAEHDFLQLGLRLDDAAAAERQQ
ncbi:MAG: hypothetical protein ABJD68_04680, partial [Nakamurella sp.]